MQLLQRPPCARRLQLDSGRRSRRRVSGRPPSPGRLGKVEYQTPPRPPAANSGGQPAPPSAPWLTASSRLRTAGTDQDSPSTGGRTPSQPSRITAGPNDAMSLKLYVSGEKERAQDRRLTQLGQHLRGSSDCRCAHQCRSAAATMRSSAATWLPHTAGRPSPGRSGRGHGSGQATRTPVPAGATQRREPEPTGPADHGSQCHRPGGTQHAPRTRATYGTGSSAAGRHPKMSRGTRSRS